MGSSDQQRLNEDMNGIADSVAEYVRQIRSGEYGPELDDVRHADVPTFVDGYGNELPIGDYPLEVVEERGKPFAVVICTGGPHIEVVAEGNNRARLEGYWGGSRATWHGDMYDEFLDWFIDR